MSWRWRRFERAWRARLSLMSGDIAAPLLPEASPMPRLTYAAPGSARSLLVFLPGIGDLAEDFERHGFVDSLARHHAHVDAIALDAHYGYYARRSLFDHLTTHVLRAAKPAGYHRIWLAGASMGGFGATAFAAHGTARLAGLLLLAPYLGERPLTDEIERAGGLRHWQPGSVTPHDPPRLAWAWLQRQVGAADGPELWLGYGQRDRFARANALLGAALPEGRTRVVEGGHDWRAWRRLWDEMVERVDF